MRRRHESRGCVFAVFVAVVITLGSGACKHGAPNVSPPDASSSSRAPDAIRRDGNHLLGASSAYLLAHAHDPVDWYPWGPEALERAKAEKKPIFLSIGYIACHWCHVMQHEVFAKDDVAAILNERFISIKVDREERPDLDRVYLAAVAAFNGSSGWPATLFLTPALEPYFGATYVDHDRFVSLATRAAAANASGGAELAGTIAELRRALAPHDPGAASPLGSEDLHAAVTSALETVDLTRGGFKGSMKFPLPSRWTFLLHAWRKWGDDGAARALRITLDAMAQGALRDPVRDGFHRYTTDARWSTPHFEEMLYDNAQLASLYLEAGRAFGEKRWIQVGSETLDFIVREMTTPSGAFAASFAADTGGVEGVAWLWSRGEVVSLLGAKEGTTVAALLDLPEGPPRAPTRRIPVQTVAESLALTPDAVEQAWSTARPKLRDARAGKAMRDDKIVTAWNGLAIGALARGFTMTGNMPWRDAAERAAEIIWRTHHEDLHRLLRTSVAPPSDAVLDDYACLAEGYLALFEADENVVWLDRTIQLVDEARARFAAPKGGFYAGDVPAPFERSVGLEDGAEPSGNAVLIRVLSRLSHVGMRGAEWNALATQTLARYAGTIREHGIDMGGWLDAALLDAGPFYEVVIAG
ncbi:MAG: thioredoxin domain-containing protein, partial [Polyangiaceae bacterium]